MWLPILIVLIYSGTGPVMMGANAEEWTSAEVRAALPATWRLHDEVGFDNSWDVDHVLVGPAGVFVLETKWRSSNRYDRRGRPTKQLRNAVQRTSTTADRFRLRLLAVPHKLRTAVHPVVVLWPAQRAGRTIQRLGDVEVVPGPKVADWLRTLTGRTLDDSTRTRVSVALNHMEEDAAARRRPLTRFVEGGVSAVSADVFVGLLGGLLAVLVTAHAWEVVARPLDATAVGGVLLSIGLAVRPLAKLRVAALGWVAGTVGMSILLMVATFLDELARTR
jgi:hypothetical protein